MCKAMINRIKFISIMVLIIIFAGYGYSSTVQKHFLNAKLAYINSDFDIAMEECSKAISLNEGNTRDIEMFFDLIKFVKKYTSMKYKEAVGFYKSGKYIKALESLSDLFKKDSKNKDAKILYSKILKKLTLKQKKERLEFINRQIKKNISLKNDAVLIALYTEALLIKPDDNTIKLELEKVRMKYKSAQTILEIKKMVKNLEKLVRKKTFDVNKAKLIVNNILYIDPSNKKAIALKKILDEYKKNDETSISELRKRVLSKSFKSTDDNVKVTKEIVKSVIHKISREKINKKDIIKQQNKNLANIHFSRGVNRYNNRLYIEAKQEFKLAKYYNPAMVEADKYIRKCEKKALKQKKIKNKIIMRDISKSKILVKKRKTEKAINLLYHSIVSNNIENTEGQRYLSGIIKENIKHNKTFVNKYSSLYDIIKYFRLTGVKLYKKNKYSESASFWEFILEFYPENRLALNYWLKSVKKMKKPENYLKHLYTKGVTAYNMGYYIKSLFYFKLVSRALLSSDTDVHFKSLKQLKENSSKFIKENNKTEEQLSRIYNAAIMEFIEGNYAGAVSKWEYILKIDPGNIKARYNIDKVNNIISGKYKMDFFNRLPEKIKQKINRYYYKGIIAYLHNRYAEAIKYFEKVVKIMPENQKAINNINKLKILLRLKQNEK